MDAFVRVLTKSCEFKEMYNVLTMSSTDSIEGKDVLRSLEEQEKKDSEAFFVSCCSISGKMGLNKASLSMAGSEEDEFVPR